MVQYSYGLPLLLPIFEVKQDKFEWKNFNFNSAAKLLYSKPENQDQSGLLQKDIYPCNLWAVNSLSVKLEVPQKICCFT